MIRKVTGLGCTASALNRRFAALILIINGSRTCYGSYGQAGERAAEIPEGPGSLQLHFLDYYSNE